MCPYAYYTENNNYNRKIIVCKKQKGKPCSFTRFCNLKNMIIPNDRIGYTMEDCKMRYEKNIPLGSSRVRKAISDKKYLYIDIENNGKIYTHKFKNPFPEKDIPEYVYIQETLDGYEIIEKTKNNTRVKK